MSSQSETTEIEKAHIIGLCLKAIFYGINSLLVWMCLFVLTCKKGRPRIMKFLIVIIVLQYLLSTTDVALVLQRIIIAFVYRRNQPGGPTYYFSDEKTPVAIVALFSISVNSILNGVIIVWRCYHVWERNLKATVFPTLLFLGTLTCVVGQGMEFITLKGSHDVFNPHIVPWSTSISALSVATNVICTLLISYRICYLLRYSWTRYAYTGLLILIIESGMLYSVVQLVGIGLYVSKSAYFATVCAQYGQFSSIISTAILLLVGLRLTSTDIQIQSTIPMEKHQMPPITDSPYGLASINSDCAEIMTLHMPALLELDRICEIPTNQLHRQTLPELDHTSKSPTLHTDDDDKSYYSQ